MAITVNWDNAEKTVLRCDFDKIWSWNDVFAMNREIERALTTVAHPVVVMMIMDGKQFPHSGTLTYTKNLFAQDHPNYARHVIFIGGNPLLKTFERIIRKAYVQSMENVRIDYADDLESARRLLDIKNQNSDNNNNCSVIR